MGIPRFFGFINGKFPDVSTSISLNAGFTTNYNDEKIDNLYLDANGILHQCSREVYFPPEFSDRNGGRKEKVRLARPHPSITEKQVELPRQQEREKPTELQVFRAIGSYMNQLLKFVQPQKVFFIAIDGPAPLAKQTQQRQRRFKSAEQRSPEEREIFDSTAITPGTAFMARLSKFLKYYIRVMMSTDPDWRRVKVIFSGSDAPGEGEHKIAQYIRKLPNKTDFVHCMYGLDADLFMLSLASHCPKFFLLREDQFSLSWTDTFFYKVDIGMLRDQLFSEWGTVNASIETIIDEFIFICFMVGNDFLHALPICSNLGESIEFLMELRKQVLSCSYITNGSLFSLNNLTLFLIYLNNVEERAISEKWTEPGFPNKTLAQSFIDPIHPDKGIDFRKYRELYYKKAGVDVSEPRQVFNFCKHYIQGLEWVNWYYHEWPLNWHWFYPYHYTPLICDLVEYLTNASSGSRLSRVSNKICRPVSPFEQLLCVVPPASKTLLPTYLRLVYNDPKLQWFYPDKFSIDLEGKLKEWEGLAILPFPELAEIQYAMEEARKKAVSKGVKVDYIRNNFGKTTEYRYKSGQKYDYSSDYGTIKNCPIVKMDVKLI